MAWVDVSTIPDDAWVCTTFSMGSSANTPMLTTEQRRALGYGEPRIARPMVEAVRDLVQTTGRSVTAIVALDLGVVDTVGPLDTALELGLRFIDGDLSGRAVPQLNQTTAAIAGIEMCPATICDGWGNRLVFRAAHSLPLAERIGKLISQATRLPDSRIICAHAGYLMTGKQLREVIVPGTISQALAAGRTIREAAQAGQDPVQAAARAVKGWVIFAGIVREKLVGKSRWLQFRRNQDRRARVVCEPSNAYLVPERKPYGVGRRRRSGEPT